MSLLYEKLQERYVSDLRQIAPHVFSWWNARAITDASEIGDQDPQNDFEARWPAGPSAHPRVLYVFRKYYIELVSLNRSRESIEIPALEESREEDWGVGIDEDSEELYVAPAQLLVEDIEAVAPDVFDLVKGIVFYPVGLRPDGEYS